MINTDGILLHLCDGFETERECLIKEVYDLVLEIIKKYDLTKYDDESNSFSDIFDLVFDYTNTAITPDSFSDMEKYNWLTQHQDLGAIVVRCICEQFKNVKVTMRDWAYIGLHSQR